MANEPLHPLTDEHLDKINQGLADIERAKVQINLAERAGIDVAQLKADAQKHDETLRKIKSVYFPGR